MGQEALRCGERRAHYATLPSLPEVAPVDADVAWLIYDLALDDVENRYILRLSKTVYTRFQPALDRITMAQAGSVEGFVASIQRKLDVKLAGDEPPNDRPPNMPVGEP